MNDPALAFTFTVPETNLLLQALGALPYAQVAPLIEKVKQQAAPQLQAIQSSNAQQATVQ